MSMAEIQAKLKAPKGQFNSFGKYKYRSCEDIVEAAKPLLSQYGYHLIMFDEVVAVLDRVYVKATCQVMNGSEVVATSSAYAREAADKKGQDDSQITGATSSYSRKYALNGLFAIDDTKDADATNKHNDEPDNDTLAKAQDALDQKDWAALCKLDREGGDDWLAVWKQIPSHKRSAMKKLMDKANEYRDLINDYDDKDDDDGILQLWEEMTKDGKSEVWRRITETAKNRITQLKKAA